MSMPIAEAQVAGISITSFNAAGFAAESLGRRLQVEISEIAVRILKQLDGISFRLLSAPTADDFCALRDKSFPSYFRLTMAMNNLIIATTDQVGYTELAQDSLSVTEREFMAIGEQYIGEEAYREALFSISTLKGAQRWLTHLYCTEPVDQIEDKELAFKYASASAWSHLHLECLELAAKNHQAIEPGILQAILAGLRQSVMAYAYVRSALDLRDSKIIPQEDLFKPTWDDEDEALANS